MHDVLLWSRIALTLVALAAGAAAVRYGILARRDRNPVRLTHHVSTRERHMHIIEQRTPLYIAVSCEDKGYSGRVVGWLVAMARGVRSGAYPLICWLDGEDEPDEMASKGFGPTPEDANTQLDKVLLAKHGPC